MANKSQWKCGYVKVLNFIDVSEIVFQFIIGKIVGFKLIYVLPRSVDGGAGTGGKIICKFFLR